MVIDASSESMDTSQYDKSKSLFFFSIYLLILLQKKKYVK